MAEEQRTKRFKYKSHKEELKEVHLPLVLNQKQLENDDVEENESLFHLGLDHWRELNLSPSFLKFANDVEPLSLSMPLLLLNWEEVVKLWTEAVNGAKDEGLRALLDLLQKLLADLRTLLLPVYKNIFSTILSILPKLVSAEELSVILSTLAALFKYILVPSLQDDTILLEETWTDMCTILKKCLPEIQTAVADAWGAFLRRLKGNGIKDKAIILLAENLQGLESVGATALVYACKSVSQTLHTNTVSLFKPLLEYHFTISTSPDLTYTLIRRSLTALMHHVKSADQFSPLAELVIELFDSTLKQYIDQRQPWSQDAVLLEEQLRRSLEVVAVPCSVRQGSRLKSSHFEQLFSLTPLLPLKLVESHSTESVPMHGAFMKFITSLYLASDMALWLGPGRNFMARLWDEGISSLSKQLHADINAANVEMRSSALSEQTPMIIESPTSPWWGLYTQFIFPFHSCLAELSWGGWKPVAVPLVLKHTLQLFSKTTEEGDATMSRMLLAFLATLRRGQKLSPSEVDVVWRERLENWSLKRLSKIGKGSDSIGNIWPEKEAAELNDFLTLSPFLSATFSKSLVELINKTLNQTSTSTNAISAWVVGRCLETLADRDPAEWLSSVDVGVWISTVAEGWTWSANVLGGLVVVSRPISTKSAFVNLADVYPSFQESIISHSRQLRLEALRLLDLPLIATTKNVQDVIKRCLQGEEASLDLQGMRERMVCIRRVVQIVGDEEGATIAAQWLIAQLKVNLRPIWSATAEAIASLSQTYGDLVWKLIFEQLTVIALKSPAKEAEDSTLSRHSENSESTSSGGDVLEEERSWRDPSARKLRSAVAKWINTPNVSLGELRESLLKCERFDAQSYEMQLLATLGRSPSLAEKHNRELVSFFLSVTNKNSQHIGNQEDVASIVVVPKLLPRPKLTAYLTLFSKFSNPKALYATGTLYTLYINLLSHPDRALQTVALACILTYKSSALVPHQEVLRLLLDETRWRDELMSFDMNALKPTDRKEMVDVLTRLLFGRMLERRGRAQGANRRAVVLAALGELDEEELGLLIELMLTPLGVESKSNMKMGVDVALDKCLKTGLVDFDAVPEKHQIGFLTLLGDVFKNLGTKLIPYWPVLISVVVGLVSHAHKKITAFAPSQEAVEQHEDELLEPGPDNDQEEEEDNEIPLTAHTIKIHRSIRQLGLKRFADFFRNPIHFDFSPFLQFSFASFISPQLALLDTGNTQAPSALLELFFAWTHNSAYVLYFVEYDSHTLPKVYDCLTATNVKPAVISRIFDIVDRLLEYSTTIKEIRELVLKPHVSLLLKNLSILVERTNVASVSTPLVQKQINILSSIAQYLTDEAQASTLITLLVPLLRKPVKDVPERVKVDLVRIVGQVLPLVSGIQNSTSVVYEKVYSSLSLLFQSLRSRAGRIALVSTFRQLANLNHSLENLASLLESLNAFSAKRIEEPDFDRRLTAFANLNENLYKTLGATDWLPVLYNSLYFIQDNDELAIRSNASLAMRRFIDFVASAPSSEFEQVFLRVLFPKLKHGLKTKSELVRAEVLGVLAYAVTRCGQVAVLKDMQILLAGGDEEASFFDNVLHVQVHRRSRALRRLAEFSNEGHFRSSLLAEVFVPLVENFIISSTSVDHHLVKDAIHATGRMARQLSWRPYYALVQKYIKLSKAKDGSERTFIRVLVSILDNFHFPMEDEVPEPEKILGDEEKEDEEVQVSDETQQLVSGTPKAMARIADAVSMRLLPTLLDHLEKHDPSTDDNARLPIAIGIANVAKHLPSSYRELQIGRLLTILSQVLRSHSQETRDLTREALQRISVVLGSAYLPQIIRELRAALTRGPQLHVLAFVTHALLVHVTSDEHAKDFESFDEIVSDIAYISTEVVFGESGKDVQAEDFKTKMREVRISSSKGLDSFSIVARFVTPPRISTLLAPLRAIMQETVSAKVTNLVDEVLKRVASGLNSNRHLAPKELVVLCHTLITQNAKFLQQAPSRNKSKARSDVIVQAKRDVTTESDHYAHNSYRFVAFGLDLLHTALRRSRFDFHNSDEMSRLNSMIVAVGNTLYSTSTPVLILGLRCAAGLVKCPLPSLGKSLPVFVKQILDIVKQTGNTEAEVVQVAFKTLAIILRDEPPVQVKEKDLIFLLELLMPDIEEPTRQASVFAILRAIVARKFVVPEIYDAMAKVAEIMVTSQSTQVQELCRGVLLQFLLDYPQGKGRLRKQMSFLAKNLSYVYESGRKSVMEFINAVISKFQIGIILEYSDLLFIALVMVVANDDSPRCREMAGNLIKALFIRLDDDRRDALFSHLHSWATQQDQPQLARMSSQVYGFIVDALQADVKSYANLIIEDLKAALEDSVQQWQREEDDENAMQVEIEWQVPYHSLSVLFKVARTLPELDISGAQIPWGLVSSYLTFPHTWVRIASSRLLGLLFSATPVSTPRQDLPDSHPLSTIGMRDAAEKMCSQLRSEHLDDALSLQVVKNLFFVSRCLYHLPIKDCNDESKEVTRTNVDEPANNRSEQEGRKGNVPLPWLFTKLSYQLRSAYIVRRNKSDNPVNWHLQPLAILRWFAAMGSFMEPSRLEQFLVHILSPLYRLMEDDTIHDSGMDEIKILAIELQELVQKKVGVLKFSNVYNRIRQSVLTTRRERKEAHAIQATADPMAAAKRKLKKNVMKKMSRKRKERTFADSKHARKKMRKE